LIIAHGTGTDLILCQITSKYHAGTGSIPLYPHDMSTGVLKDLSYIRPDKLFTADEAMIQYTLGHVNNIIIKTVVDVIVSIIQSK
jgi:mRNA interferase MazF